MNGLRALSGTRKELARTGNGALNRRFASRMWEAGDSRKSDAPLGRPITREQN